MEGESACSLFHSQMLVVCADKLMYFQSVFCSVGEINLHDKTNILEICTHTVHVNASKSFAAF